MPAGDALDTYRHKRDFSATPEPRGDAAPHDAGGFRFVVQEHHARRLHWDFRLEHDGVAASWAVPRGIPLEPVVLRLAVQTEDHPLDYMDFEGEIPPGEYGAGRVLIWDRGTYDCEKWTDREVKVVLHGERIDGRYVLIKTNGRRWLMRRLDPPQ
jgi:bifunctional non-homologous end joining protein LigD